MDEPFDTARALEVARSAASAGLAALAEGRDRTGPADAVEKRPRDLVTAVDREAERRIVEVLTGAFPDHAILAEESGDGGGASRWRWVVDPLDGTANYVHGFPVWAVSIALLEDDEPVVGVVVDAARGEWFTARAGAGGLVERPGRSARPLAVSASPPGEAIVATGFPFRRRELLDRYLAAFAAVFPEVSDMRRTGSAALDLAWTAAGRLGGFWEMGLARWDTAAGELLVREAGGVVSDWRGGPDHRASGWIAAGSPAVHPALVETLAEFA